jgi:hypothetical protein
VAYQLKIALQGMRPPVWRRVLVPETIRMDALHTVIQIAMGWTDSHLHSFTKDGNCWTVPDPDAYAVSLDLDERKFRLPEVLKKTSDSLLYVYDFGDDWRHKVTLEKVVPGPLVAPTCIGGKGGCPMEDSGGFDPEFEDEDAEDFSVAATAAALQSERWPHGAFA